MRGSRFAGARMGRVFPAEHSVGLGRNSNRAFREVAHTRPGKLTGVRAGHVGRCGGGPNEMSGL